MTRRKLEVILVIAAILIGTPIAMVLGTQHGKQIAEVLYGTGEQ